MALPIRATSKDIQQTCGYLATKPTGATVKDINGVLGKKYGDHRRLAAVKAWGLIDQQDDGKWKVTENGRRCVKDQEGRIAALGATIRSIPAYLAVVERAVHRKEDALTTTDVSAHWHEHFKDEVGDSEDSIKKQAVCFFQVAEGAGLGSLMVGRRGALTRLSFNVKALSTFAAGGRAAAIAEQDKEETGKESSKGKDTPTQTEAADEPPSSTPGDTPSQVQAANRKTGQGIFVAHGKNKKHSRNSRRYSSSSRSHIRSPLTTSPIWAVQSGARSVT